jgi:hypothetical protein
VEDTNPVLTWTIIGIFVVPLTICLFLFVLRLFKVAKKVEEKIMKD